jgi:hypothetical protein
MVVEAQKSKKHLRTVARRQRALFMSNLVAEASERAVVNVKQTEEGELLELCY